MASSENRGQIVLEGTWPYADVCCRVAIVRRDTHYGSGDLADDPNVANDAERETFEILYTSPDDPYRFTAGGGQYGSIEEARIAAELACHDPIHWSES